ncbi:MAG: PLP-dependent aminotransferase family protein, partial [Clostridia bacterium]|nr:PLP-dependent aminotransferase family protein [Clostridia bacterium]
MKFTDELFSRNMAPVTGSAIRDIFKLLGKPGMISFAGGNPSNAALEPDIIEPIADRVVRELGRPLLQYGGSEGFAPLRESAAAFLYTS